jgi:hypothetical protein
MVVYGQRNQQSREYIEQVRQMMEDFAGPGGMEAALAAANQRVEEIVVTGNASNVTRFDLDGWSMVQLLVQGARQHSAAAEWFIDLPGIGLASWVDGLAGCSRGNHADCAMILIGGVTGGEGKPVAGAVTKGAERVVKVFSKAKQALLDMAKADKRAGATRADMKAYQELNNELPDPFPSNKVRVDEGHLRGAPHSQVPHGHVGSVDHIPILDS